MDSCTCADRLLPSCPSMEYLNQRHWSQESNNYPKRSRASTLHLPPEASTRHSLTLCETSTIPGRGRKNSWSPGGNDNLEKGDDVCRIVVTDADPRSDPWGRSKRERDATSWLARFTAVTTQEPKEKKSIKKDPASPGLSE